MNHPLQALRAILVNAPGKRFGVVHKITTESLYVRSGGQTIVVPYRLGYRKGQRVIINEHNVLVGKAATAGNIRIYVV